MQIMNKKFGGALLAMAALSMGSAHVLAEKPETLIEKAVHAAQCIWRNRAVDNAERALSAAQSSSRAADQARKRAGAAYTECHDGWDRAFVAAATKNRQVDVECTTYVRTNPGVKCPYKYVALPKLVETCASEITADNDAVARYKAAETNVSEKEKALNQAKRQAKGC